MKFYIFVMLFVVAAAEADKNALEEARGKGKYALLTHLAIVLATKVGLYKIVLGIALVLASMKILVVMAWALAISKHVPHAWPNFKNDYSHHYYPEKGPPPIPSTGVLDWMSVHFFYVVATKVFVLKIIYGIIFYVLLTKGWHFVLWFVHYLKEKKHEEYIDHEPVYYHGHDHGHHFEHHDYEPYGYSKTGYGADYSPYRKKVYDSDGSYAVKS